MVALKILQDETGQPINSLTLTERLFFCEKFFIYLQPVLRTLDFSDIYIYIYNNNNNNNNTEI